MCACTAVGGDRGCRRPSVLRASVQERSQPGAAPAAATAMPGAGTSEAAMGPAEAPATAAAERPVPPPTSGQAPTAACTPGHHPATLRPRDPPAPGDTGGGRVAEASPSQAAGDATNGPVRPKEAVVQETTVSNKMAASNDENNSAAAGNMMVRLTAGDGFSWRSAILMLVWWCCSHAHPHALQPGESRTAL